jgi:hypothetical protein
MTFRMGTQVRVKPASGSVFAGLVGTVTGTRGSQALWVSYMVTRGPGKPPREARIPIKARMLERVRPLDSGA